MTRYAALLTIFAMTTITADALAVPTAPFQEVHADYNPVTGEIRVSVNSAVNWYVEHIGFLSMTGDEPLGIPAGGGVVSNNDTRIGESSFSITPMIYDVSLGNVAATGIPNDGTLVVIWNAELGHVAQLPVAFFVPEPTSLILASLGLIGVGCFRRRNSRL